MIRAKAIVTLKKEVSDVQGKTIQQTVAKMDYPEVKAVRVGKYFEIEMDCDETAAREKLDRLCESVLSNPVIEEFEYDLIRE